MSRATQAFIIHLDRAEARKPQVKRLLAASPVPARVVDAVDGRTLAPEEIARIFVPEGLYRPKYPFLLSPGEIGCLLSHRRIWKMIVEGGLDYGLVFEDDAEIGTDFPKVLKFALAHASLEDYIQFPVRPLRGKHETLASEGDLSLVKAQVTPLRTSAQFVGRHAAEKLLAASERFDRPVDTFLQMHWETGVPLKTAMPSGISDRTEESGGSTIKGRKSFAERLSREFKRWRYRAAIARLSDRRRRS